MTVQMQARSSSNGQLYSWLSSSPDWAMAGFPGPGSGQEPAVSMRPAAVVGDGGGGVENPPIVVITTATLTIGSIHIGKRLECSNAAGCAITVPENILAAAEWFDAYATHSGQQITFIEGSNVQIDQPAALNAKTREQWSVATVVCRAVGATDFFLLTGDLEVA